MTRRQARGWGVPLLRPTAVETPVRGCSRSRARNVTLVPEGLISDASRNSVASLQLIRGAICKRREPLLISWKMPLPLLLPGVSWGAESGRQLKRGVLDFSRGWVFFPVFSNILSLTLLPWVPSPEFCWRLCLG